MLKMLLFFPMYLVLTVSKITNAAVNTTFVCVDGSKITLGQVCDGIPHCTDSSDEIRKLCHHVVCPISMYRCAYGACVSKKARCDGFQDCIDGSDEMRCNSLQTCSDRQHECTSSSECIPLSNVCNGYVDCADGSDENTTLCKDYLCPPHTFSCAYGGCIHQEVICDGIKDCIDGSDEDHNLCASMYCQGRECEKYSCRGNEYTCDNGRQCISSENVCDGSYQCIDASDEKPELCKIKSCPEDFFRCSYGACIPQSLKCNLEPNCHDWSDEDELVCGVSLPDGACRLPPAKPGTRYRASNCDKCRPGDVVPQFTRLDFSCDEKHVLEGSSATYCRDHHWLPSLPTCPSNSDESITCPPIIAAGATKRCQVMWGPRQGRLSCDQPLPISTRVTLECPSFYERKIGSFHVTCLHDGTWSQTPLSCRSVCGFIESSVSALIVKGWNVSDDETLPWQATLFSHENGKWVFFCGGTLIAERIVLTAAHCVWKASVDTIKVTLTTFSSNFSKFDEKTQIFNIEKIEIHYSYQDHDGNYGSDLALLILKKPARLNSMVVPACLDWMNVRDVSSRIGDVGFVAGFGVTENDKFSDKLRVASVKIVSDEQCQEHHMKDFRKYLTYTSFCAGWANGTGPCNGDSGGGLILRVPNTTIWEIHGIVSISPRRLGTAFCDPNFYTIFTKISVYYKWIKEVVDSVQIIGPGDDEQENEGIVL